MSGGAGGGKNLLAFSSLMGYSSVRGGNHPEGV